MWTAATPLDVDLRSGRFTGGTVSSIEKVRGGAGDDTPIGSDAPELLQGADGADAIAGLGGADLLIGYGVFSLSPGADAIDGGAGDALIDVSNRAFQPFGPAIVATARGPADRLSCGDGYDRVDACSSQLVPANCEGARVFGATATVPLRPAVLPGGTLVFDVPCSATKYFGGPVRRCDGTVTVTRSSDGMGDRLEPVLDRRRRPQRGLRHAILAGRERPDDRSADQGRVRQHSARRRRAVRGRLGARALSGRLRDSGAGAERAQRARSSGGT